MRVYYDRDADINLIKDKKIVIFDLDGTLALIDKRRKISTKFRISDVVDPPNKATLISLRSFWSESSFRIDLLFLKIVFVLNG